LKENKILSSVKNSKAGDVLRNLRDKYISAPKAETVSMTFYDTPNSHDQKLQTYIVAGAARGGTTAICSVVRDLGIFMGDNLGHNLEDSEFHQGPLKLPKVIENRNNRFDVWGWKRPDSPRILGKVIDDLRNPRLILVTRDPVAVGLSLTKRNDRTKEAALAASMASLQKNLEVMHDLKIPSLVISYEKAVLSPKVAVQEIASFLCLDVSESKIHTISKFIKPGRYRSAQAK
jgi:hypothetical protein